MSRTAFIFPGQGAQYTGMAKDFYEQNIASRSIFDMASKLLEMDMEALCFKENDKLNQTEYTQAALLTAQLAMLEAVREKNITCEVTAGLSLGEYAALAASGKMNIKDALTVVRKRGQFMQNAMPAGGAMSAVLGLDGEKVSAICAKAEGVVETANYNCPGQIVISGEEKAVQAVETALKEAGARKVMPLKVSGPFHSSLMKKAGNQLAEVLEQISFQASDIPYVSNVTADYVRSIDEIKDLLVSQVSSSVRWEQSIRRMIEDGIDTFIEIGPGKTLAGFLRRIDKNVKVINIEKYADLDKLDGLDS